MRSKLIERGLWSEDDLRDPEYDFCAAWDVAERLRETMDLTIEIRTPGRRFGSGLYRVREFDYGCELCTVEDTSLPRAIVEACEQASHYSGWETTTR